MKNEVTKLAMNGMHSIDSLILEASVIMREPGCSINDGTIRGVSLESLDRVEKLVSELRVHWRKLAQLVWSDQLYAKLRVARVNAGLGALESIDESPWRAPSYHHLVWHIVDKAYNDLLVDLELNQIGTGCLMGLDIDLEKVKDNVILEGEQLSPDSDESLILCTWGSFAHAYLNVMGNSSESSDQKTADVRDRIRKSLKSHVEVKRDVAGERQQMLDVRDILKRLPLSNESQPTAEQAERIKRSFPRYSSHLGK